MNKRKIIFFLLLLVTVKLSAIEYTRLIVDMRDGSSAMVQLIEKPTITFDGEMMKIVSAKTTLEFSRRDVKKYRFYRHEVSSVEELSLSPQATIEDNTIIVSGIADGVPITVYTASGTVVCCAVADGCSCTVSLESLPCGLYIVTYNDTTIKFLKR